jgi:hypothetical protein
MPPAIVRTAPEPTPYASIAACGLLEPGVRQSKVIIGTEINHAPAVVDADSCLLSLQFAGPTVQPMRAQRRELVVECGATILTLSHSVQIPPCSGRCWSRRPRRGPGELLFLPLPDQRLVKPRRLPEVSTNECRNSGGNARL